MDPESTIVRLRLAAEYLKLGQLNEAIEYTEDAVEKNKSSEEGRLFLGGLYTSLRMYDKAIDQYEKLLEFYPNQLEGYIHMGALFAEQKNYKKAEEVFLKLLKHPNNEKLHIPYYYLGGIYMEQGEDFLLKAEKTFLKSLRSKSNYENSMLALVKLYESKGEQKKAVELASSFQEKFGPKKHTARYLSVIYLRNGNHKKALAQLRHLDSFEKDNLDTKMKLSLIFIELKYLKQAAHKLEEILVIAPQSDKIHFYLAVVYEELDKPLQSIENFTKVPSSSSYYRDSIIHVVNIYKKENKLDNAIKAVRGALDLRKDVVQFYLVYASLLSEKKNYKMAISTLLESVKTFPQNTQVKFLLGTLFDRVGQLDQTIVQMNKILEIDENHVQALNYLAYTYAEQGGPLKEAEQLARRALKLQPKNPYILDTMGWVLFKKGETKQAIAFLETAHKTRPSESVVAEHLGDAYYRFELAEKAKQMYKKAMETTSDDKKIKQIRTKITNIERSLQRHPASIEKPSP